MFLAWLRRVLKRRKVKISDGGLKRSRTKKNANVKKRWKDLLRVVSARKDKSKGRHVRGNISSGSSSSEAADGNGMLALMCVMNRSSKHSAMAPKCCSHYSKHKNIFNF